MATPHVAGAAALLWARAPAATVAQVRTALLGSVEPRPALLGRTVTGGVLNAARAVTSIDPDAAAPAPAPTPAPAVPIAPAPAPAPSLSPGAGRDTTAPALRVSVPGRQRLATVMRRGVVARATCSEACTLRTRLLVSRSTASRLGVRAGRDGAVVGRSRAGAPGARRTTIRTRLSRRSLRRSRSVRLRLELRAIDAAGNTRIVTRPVALRR